MHILVNLHLFTMHISILVVLHLTTLDTAIGNFTPCPSLLSLLVINHLVLISPFLIAELIWNCSAPAPCCSSFSALISSLSIVSSNKDAKKMQQGDAG